RGQGPGAGAIARGMGRSYGDAAQLRDGVVLDTTNFKGIMLDSEREIVRAQAGVTIGELLARLVPAGWMVPVVPGTQHVTVGGALSALQAPGGPHRVAWLDLLGSRRGRGIVTRADHLDASEATSTGRTGATIAARATVPAWWPGGVLRPGTVRAFNELRFRS